jgi:hypothetical protein
MKDSRAPGAGAAPERPTNIEQRRETRIPSQLRVTTATIDPVADPVTGERVFQTSDEDATVNLSRRGICLVATRAPDVGTRVLVELHIPEERPVELIGRTRWTRVEFEPGIGGARPTCLVGIEVLGGSPRAIERFEASIRELEPSS